MKKAEPHTPHDASVYRKAARLLEEDAPSGYGHIGSPYSCDRIGQATGWFSHTAKPADLVRFRALAERYEELFKPEDAMMGWWSLGKDGRDCRIVALCLMAAMVETGDA